jgi:hypothetical protein
MDPLTALVGTDEERPGAARDDRPVPGLRAVKPRDSLAMRIRRISSVTTST